MKNKYNKITLTKKQAKDQKDMINFLKSFPGTIIRKLLSGKIIIYVLRPKQNNSLSGSGVLIRTPYETSGIIHK